MAVIVKAENFDDIESSWLEILSHSSGNTIFINPAWQKLWWSRFGRNADLRIISFSEDDKIIGIAPIMLKDGVLSFLGDTDLFDYHDFIVRTGYEEDFYDSLWAYVLPLEWTEIVLKSVREGSPIFEHLGRLADDEHFVKEIKQEDVSPFTPLCDSWDDYLLTLRKKDRHELRRKLRRLERENTSAQYVYVEPDQIDASLPDFFRLMRASSGEKNDFLTEEREMFFRDMVATLSSLGMLRLYFLEVDLNRVAACICFDYDGQYLLYNSGYDPEYSSLSVGLLNKALCLKDAIEEGKYSFDFLRGTERYKYNLGAQDQLVYEMIVRRRA